SLTTERRSKQVCRTRHRELRKVLTRYARECVQHVRRSPFVENVVEKGPELSADDYGGCVSQTLHELLEVEFGRQHLSRSIYRLENFTLCLELDSRGLFLCQQVVALRFRALAPDQLADLASDCAKGLQ